MSPSRLEAFSDGVIAVIITITVLDFKIPPGNTFASLEAQIPLFVTYVLSFVNVGIYWNNHHHLFAAAERVDGRTMWANLHLLFWLSLIPFTTGWAGDDRFATAPTVTYGFVLLMCGFAYGVLQARIVAANGGSQSTLARALGSDWKGKVSVGSYAVALLIAFVAPIISGFIFIAIAALWFVPDRRVERVVGTDDG